MPTSLRPRPGPFSGPRPARRERWAIRFRSSLCALSLDQGPGYNASHRCRPPSKGAVDRAPAQRKQRLTSLPPRAYRIGRAPSPVEAARTAARPVAAGGAWRSLVETQGVYCRCSFAMPLLQPSVSGLPLLGDDLPRSRSLRWRTAAGGSHRQPRSHHAKVSCSLHQRRPEAPPAHPRLGTPSSDTRRRVKATWLLKHVTGPPANRRRPRVRGRTSQPFL